MSVPATGLSADELQKRRATTSGCTSPGCPGTRTARCRSSCAATGATWKTSTASATWTRSRTLRRQHRLRLRRRDRGGGSGAVARAALLHELELRAPRAIELAAEVASVAPGDLNRVFFCSGGSEAVESAWKLARQYHAARGEHRWKAIARRIAYQDDHGALSITGIAALKTPFEPLVPDTLHVHNTNRYHRPPEETEAEFTAFLLDDLESMIEHTGPDTVAMVIMEPVQNAGGSFTPPEGYWAGVREICDRYGILLCADEVICGFGRLGAWFGSERYDIRPDLITSAKGSPRRTRPSAPSSLPTGSWSRSSRATRCTCTGSPSAAIPSRRRSRSRTSRSCGASASSSASPSSRTRSRRRWPSCSSCDRGRPARDGVLLRPRARQGQGDPRDLLRGRSNAPPRLLAAPLRGGPHLPRRRPRRPGRPDLAAARRGQAQFDEIVGILEVLAEAWEQMGRSAALAVRCGSPRSPLGR